MPANKPGRLMSPSTINTGLLMSTSTINTGLLMSPSTPSYYLFCYAEGYGNENNERQGCRSSGFCERQGCRSSGFCERQGCRSSGGVIDVYN